MSTQSCVINWSIDTLFSRSKSRPCISRWGQLSSARIFHLNADIIKTCFEVLRVIFSLLIKHCKLHPQLFVFDLPHLLQREGWDGMQAEGRQDMRENGSNKVAIKHHSFTDCVCQPVSKTDASVSKTSKVSKTVEMCIVGESL